MTDTSPNIKELQLKIWLAKSPMERLRQFLIDNEVLYKFWNDSKKKIEIVTDSSMRPIDEK